MKQNKVSTTSWGLLIAGLLMTAGIIPPGLAADRALLIGVGKYRVEAANLPGIDLDIEMMKNTAGLLGFKESEVKVLMDEQATLQNVDRTMRDWLVNGVSPQDRVLIYYSGHGTNVHDESGDEDDDRVDEVLTMHDLAIVRRSEKATLSGVMLDDRFAEILKQIPSKNVLVVVDACHSGTATKDLTLRSAKLGERHGVYKAFYYPGMPKSTKGNIVPVQRKSTQDSFVALTAARDDEKAVATEKGSVFTLGIHEAIRQAAASGESLTPNDLNEKASQFIEQNVDPEQRYHPQLNGDLKMANTPLQIGKRLQANGPVWHKIERLVRSSKSLSVEANKSAFMEGDVMYIHVDVSRGGYLNVVNIGPKDDPTVLFPNQFHPDNRVQPGRLTLPTETMDFDLVARAPFGPSLTAAFLTDEYVNLYESGMALRNDKGEILDVFSGLSEVGLRSLRSIVPEKKKGKGGQIQAGMLEVRVCASIGECR
jgi:uncharacterized caspase-like protein